MLRPIPFDEFPPESEKPDPAQPFHGSASREEMETCLTCPLEECTPMRGDCPLRVGFIAG